MTNAAYPLAEQAIRILEDAREAGYFPSASLRVFDREGTLFHHEMGDVREHSLFDVASLTKIPTSTLVLLAVERGLLALEQPIVDLLPDQLGDSELQVRLQGITVDRLLSHSSTLPAWYPTYADGRDFPVMIKAAILSQPPAEGVLYSDLNYMLLGKLVERLYRLPLAQCLQQVLVKPLQLGQMLYCPGAGLDIIPSGYGNPSEEQMCPEMGLHYDRWRAQQLLVGQVHDGNAWYYFGGVAGHAGIFATAEAFEKLVRLYLTTSSPVLVDSLREWAPTRGLGWQMGDMYPFGCGHTGFTGTSVYLSREKNIGCVLMTNRLSYPNRAPMLTNPIRRAMHKLVSGVEGL